MTGLQLAQTGIIPAGTLYKTVITLRLINLEPTARDSIEEIDAFISGEAKKMQARKEHLAAIIAKINAGKQPFFCVNLTIPNDIEPAGAPDRLTL